MTYTELLKTISDAGVFAYHVLASFDGEDREFLLFDGDLNAFLSAAKHAGAQVFVSRNSLTDSGFTYEFEPDSEETDDEAAETVEIDLCSVSKDLTAYRQFIGRDGQFSLWFEAGTAKIIFGHDENWWGEFVQERDAAIEKVDSDREKMAKKAIEQRETKDAELIKNLRKLVGDFDFVKLPSQMAMKEYALEKFPDLGKVDPRRLQVEIQNLNARIQAKGLRRTKRRE